MTAKSRKKTTPSRPRKETVAEPQEVASEDEAVAPATSDVVEEPTATVAAEPALPDDVPEVAAPSDQANGYCDNHPDRPAVLKTNFSWTPPQRFCARCVPAHYRHLL